MFTLSTFWSVRRIEIKKSKINVIFCLRKLDNFLEGYIWKWFFSIALISSKLDLYFMYLESSQNSC